jgi:hypothetical protein
MRKQGRFASAVIVLVSCGHTDTVSSRPGADPLTCQTRTTASDVAARLPAVVLGTTAGYTPTFVVLVPTTDAVAGVMRLTETRKTSTDVAWAASYGGLAVVESSSKPASDADGCALATLVRSVPGAIVIDVRRESRPTIVAQV